MKSWRRRWIVVDGSTLYSFKEARDYNSPTETIDLTAYASVKSSEDLTHKANSFDVYSAEESISFAASRGKEKEEWIRVLGKAIVKSRTKNFQQDIDAYGNVKDSK